MSRLVETTVDSRLVYDGRMLKVRFDNVVAADGSPAWREWVQHPPGVIIVPVVDAAPGAERIVMLRQFRYAVRRQMIELPAGLLDVDGEAVADAARRELEEETGYRAADITRLGRFFSQSGFSNDFCEIYLATGLTPGPRNLEAGEVIECFEIGLEQAIADGLASSADGEAHIDARTVFALLLAQRHLRQNAAAL